MSASSPRPLIPPNLRHQWIEERVFSTETLRHDRRRVCARCGTGAVTDSVNPQPCPGRRVSPWE